MSQICSQSSDYQSSELRWHVHGSPGNAFCLSLSLLFPVNEFHLVFLCP